MSAFADGSGPVKSSTPPFVFYSPVTGGLSDSYHPAVFNLLKYFDYQHLPTHLQAFSKPFYDLAWSLANTADLNGPELTVGLRKLLEAKDCVVRAAAL